MISHHVSFELYVQPERPCLFRSGHLPVVSSSGDRLPHPATSSFSLLQLRALSHSMIMNRM